MASLSALFRCPVINFERPQLPWFAAVLLSVLVTSAFCDQAAESAGEAYVLSCEALSVSTAAMRIHDHPLLPLSRVGGRDTSGPRPSHSPAEVAAHLVFTSSSPGRHRRGLGDEHVFSSRFRLLRVFRI